MAVNEAESTHRGTEISGHGEKLESGVWWLVGGCSTLDGSRKIVSRLL